MIREYYLDGQQVQYGIKIGFSDGQYRAHFSVVPARDEMTNGWYVKSPERHYFQQPIEMSISFPSLASKTT